MHILEMLIFINGYLKDLKKRIKREEKVEIKQESEGTPRTRVEWNIKKPQKVAIVESNCETLFLINQNVIQFIINELPSMNLNEI